jgi:DNA replication and repair protein RecF
LIHGVNGAGKTSILEAIFVLGFGKSFLNVKKSEMVNDASDHFSIQADILDLENHHSTVNSFYGNSFSLLLNKKKSTIFDISGYLYPVIFSSSNYNLYIESKTYTRKLMDRFIFGVESLYLHYLLSYNKALKQKNYLLKTRKNIDEIRSWNKTISEMVEKMTYTKSKFIDNLNTEIDRKFNTGLHIDYSPSISSGSRDFIFQHLERLLQSEIMYKRALAGPHLDNFDFSLKGKHLKLFSSGEKKINLLMIYISFIELFKIVRNDYPIFLVDDFDTAMDTRNINFLIDNYPDLQVIATSVNKCSSFDRSIELIKEC